MIGAFSASCDNAGADRVLSIDATGEVFGLVYFDANANREPDDADSELAGVRVSLVSAEGAEPVASALSDEAGVVELAGVPVGNYQVVVDTATIGDSTIVADIDSSEVTVARADTQAVLVAISFPALTIGEAIALPAGSRTFVDGVALTPSGVFGDSTLHIADSSGALRAVRVGAATIAVGDSVRLRGALASRDGQPVLDLNRAVPQVVAAAEAPPPDTITTAEAATAGSGVLDAALVRIDSARVVDTATVGDDLVASVDDGSGELEIVLDGEITFDLGPYFLPGVDVAVSGILVPGATAWRLKPRRNDDMEVSPPVLPVAQVKSAAPGDVVFLDGKVLTPMSVAAQSTVFGDSVVHVADTSGAIRLTRVRPIDLAVGDSVRVIGRTVVREGQVVVDEPTLFLLTPSFPPQPRTVTTAEAADANGGLLDAALVRVDSARILDTTTVDDDLVVSVSDGTGSLDVVLDGDVSFDPGPYFLPGADIALNGVLVPTGSSWRLKPRGNVEVEVTAPVVAISQVRATSLGQVVFLDGKILTPMSGAAQATVFGDSTVHVADTSGAIRVTRVKPVDLSTGDSVRFVGTTALRDGQLVVDQATAFVLAASFPPLPVTVTTGEAASARVGELDAAYVRVDSARITDTTTVNGELVIAVSDGSGSLEILIDEDITFNPGQYLLPGADIAARGVLVPSGGSWQLKPRGDADVAITAPVISIAEARSADIGEIVFVDGTALNYVVPSVAGAPPRTAFRDTTIHVSDPAGAIRGKRIVVPGSDVTAGDSVRLYGQIALVGGQPVISDTRLFRLDDRPELPLPSAVPLTSAEAATASDGSADAAFVAVSGASVTDTATVGDDFHATVDDGSGPVVVVFDGDITWPDLALYVRGAVLDVWGLLVPDGAGSWVLKPRGAGDVST